MTQINRERWSPRCTPGRPCATRAAVWAFTTWVVGTAWAAAQITSAPPALGFQGIWYEVRTAGQPGNKYGGGMATYPQQIAPLAIYVPQVRKTFFTFGVDLDAGPGRRLGHAVSYFDHASGMLARPRVWLDKQTQDAHDAPVLVIDNQGYLYLFSMTHGEARRAWIRKSSAPYEIASHVELLSPADADDMAVFGNPPESPGMRGGPRFSYASAWYVPQTPIETKFLLLHTRYQYDPVAQVYNQRDLFSTSSRDADVWSPRMSLAQIAEGQYQTAWIKPDGRTVGTIFNVHPAGRGCTPLDARTHLFYLQTADQGMTWQTVDGITLVDHRGARSGPLTVLPDPGAEGCAYVYQAGPEERVYLKDVNYDSQGRPVILFLTSPTHVSGDFGTPGPDRFVKTARWKGQGWEICELTTTDHNYDHGSIYVEPDGSWRVMAPFLDGPQAFATGGEVGLWTSSDEGHHWVLQRQVTDGSAWNHSYVRRPLWAHEQFYAFWSAGHALRPSAVELYFATRDGQVFRMPYDASADFVRPEPFGPQ